MKVEEPFAHNKLNRKCTYWYTHTHAHNYAKTYTNTPFTAINAAQYSETVDSNNEVNGESNRFKQQPLSSHAPTHTHRHAPTHAQTDTHKHTCLQHTDLWLTLGFHSPAAHHPKMLPEVPVGGDEVNAEGGQLGTGRHRKHEKTTV